MKTLNRSLLAMALSAMAFAATAGQYTFQDKQYKVTVDAKEITAVQCDVDKGQVKKDSCKTNVAEVAPLLERLQKRLDEANELLKEEGVLTAKAKKMATAKDAEKIVDDASGDTYVMLNLAEGFYLPLNSKLIEKGDYSLVVDALKANRSRYERAIGYLKGGKLPADVSTDNYSEVSDMLELVNIVEFSKVL